jgi:hypothetical protein
MKNNIHNCKWLPASIFALGAWLCINFTSPDSLAQQDLDNNSDAPSIQPAIQSANDIIAPEEADDIRDIHSLIKIPYPWLPYVIILGSVIAFHLILFFLFKWLKHRKRKKEEAIKLTPYDQALKDLKNTRFLMDAGQDKAFSIAVSNVLRNYLEGQFAMPAPERTTEEFLSEISGHDLIKESLEELLSGFLQLCDLVKFADQPLGSGQMKELYDKAENFIEESYVKSHMQAAMLGQDTATIMSKAS